MKSLLIDANISSGGNKAHHEHCQLCNSMSAPRPHGNILDIVEVTPR